MNNPKIIPNSPNIPTRETTANVVKLLQEAGVTTASPAAVAFWISEKINTTGKTDKQITKAILKYFSGKY